MLENIELLCHSSIKIKRKKIIYIDPFKIKENTNDADIIFCTHSHYDHFSEEDIMKIKKENTKIVIPEDIITKVMKLGFYRENILVVEPNSEYSIDDIYFNTINSYNTDKNFHPKENLWVGYIIELNNVKYYIAGDTDITEENKKVKCDVAFLPIGGIYTMNFKEAASLANTIKPKIVVPTHYGEIVGRTEDGENFEKLLSETIKCKRYI
ncbi:MAG: MBL fold metallo-hydrolase [Candidatus Scatovivens sp.]